jgi:hypothetical protein
MGEVDLRDLAARVEGLERRLDLWRRWAVGLGALALAGLAVGARPDLPKDPAEGVFRGRKVILRDERGEVRAVLQYAQRETEYMLGSFPSLPFDLIEPSRGISRDSEGRSDERQQAGPSDRHERRS